MFWQHRLWSELTLLCQLTGTPPKWGEISCLSWPWECLGVLQKRLRRWQDGSWLLQKSSRLRCGIANGITVNGLILYIFRLYWYTLPRTKTVYYRANVIWAFSQKEAGWIINCWKCQCPQRVNIMEMLVNRGVDFQLFQLKIAALHSLTVVSLLTAVSCSYCSDKTLHFLLPRDARGKGNFTFMTRSEDKIREPYCSAEFMPAFFMFMNFYVHFLLLSTFQ